MSAMHPDLDAALSAGRGVMARRNHPRLKGIIDGAVRRGELTRLLPGIYARTAEARSLEIRARAARLAEPNAIVTGAAAAVLGGWAHVPPPRDITIATEGLRTTQPGYRFERRRVDPTLTRRMDGYVITARPLTALDLAVEQGDAALADALRLGVPLLDLNRALILSPGRRGFARLRTTLAMMRDRPWSPLELEAHKLLRQAHVTGWEGNRAIYDARGEELLAYGDLVFGALGLDIELDGRHVHASARSRDLARDLRLARHGWQVVRVASDLVFSSPAEFVAAVRDIVRLRRPEPPR